MSEELLSPQELAKKLHISVKTVYSWAQKNCIPYLKIESSLRFDWDKIKEWLQTKEKNY